MGGEILIVIVGFFRWISKGCKRNLADEINGRKKENENIRGQNYIIGILIFIILILIFIS